MPDPTIQELLESLFLAGYNGDQATKAAVSALIHNRVTALVERAVLIAHYESED
jgi:citrate lyase gamma subunit